RNNQHGFYESVSKERLPIVEDSPAPGDLSIALVSSAWKGKTNIMTMGWHMMLGFSPALFACYIWDGNHSFEMIRRSKQCVINVPTTDLAIMSWRCWQPSKPRGARNSLCVRCGRK